MMRPLLGILFVGATTLSPRAQEVLGFPRYRLVESVKDRDDLPISGAKLCLLAPKSLCYAMPPEYERGANKVQYEFGLTPVSERLRLKNGGSLVFFLATFSGGGSGTLERASLLRYEPEGTITNLLPYVAVTNQSQRQMWSLPSFSEYPLLVTADFIWDFKAHETHFARHFYEVAIYRFNQRLDRYSKLLSYRTSEKYAGLDDSRGVNVLRPERSEIVRRLKEVLPTN